MPLRTTILKQVNIAQRSLAEIRGRIQEAADPGGVFSFRAGRDVPPLRSSVSTSSG